MTTHQLIRGGSLRYVHVHYISLSCLRSSPMLYRDSEYRFTVAYVQKICEHLVGSKNVDDVTLIAILSLYHVGLYQINLF